MLVQGTGSGKSSVPQTVAVVDGGVTIVIENTLALGSDQQSKVVDANEYFGGEVLGIQLDELKHKEEQQQLAHSLRNDMNVNSTTAIILFTSPETIARPIWLDLIEHLIENKKLKLMCIDEVHLFVEFGVTFRPSFCELKQKLFSLLIHNSNDSLSSPSNATSVPHSTSSSHTNALSHSTSLKIPLLCMTATFNQYLLLLLQKMLGITFNIKNFFWNGPDSFERRNIRISLKYSNQIFRFVKECLNTHLKPHIESKAIICSNSAASLQALQPRIDNWMDSDDNFRRRHCVSNW
jgi:superfamily II DNA helicase RecQ